MLLPTKYYFTEVVIKECQKIVFYDGISETLASLRERYWVFRGLEAVKKLIRKCAVSQRYEGKTYTGPPTPDVPAQRVGANPPFNNTGIDFAGPLYTHTSEAKENKAYTVFAYSHVLPLKPYTWRSQKECQPSTFLLAFRRFCGRRGISLIILSDNADIQTLC